MLDIVLINAACSLTFISEMSPQWWGNKPYQLLTRLDIGHICLEFYAVCPTLKLGPLLLWIRISLDVFEQLASHFPAVICFWISYLFMLDFRVAH
jgi:hypothetical protein